MTVSDQFICLFVPNERKLNQCILTRPENCRDRLIKPSRIKLLNTQLRFKMGPFYPHVKLNASVLMGCNYRQYSSRFFFCANYDFHDLMYRFLYALPNFAVLSIDFFALLIDFCT